MLAILLVFTWHELMGVPNEIYIESWNEERQRGGAHQIEKAVVVVSNSSLEECQKRLYA
jgi:hypothetical protein